MIFLDKNPVENLPNEIKLDHNFICFCERENCIIVKCLTCGLRIKYYKNTNNFYNLDRDGNYYFDREMYSCTEIMIKKIID